MKIIAAALALALTGCAGNIRLVEGGKVYPGKFQMAGKTIEATIDGVLYKGTYITDSQTSVGGMWIAGRYIATTATRGGNTGRALLLSPDNKALRCEFMAQGMSAQGTCQDSTGRNFDMVTGE